jgi:hypothetical protein
MLRDGDLQTAWLLEEHDASLVAAVLGGIVADSDDELERIAGLALLEGVQGMPREELPEAAYEGIRERTSIEVRLLLKRHETLPITRPAVADELDEVSRDVSLAPGQRYASVNALAHPETSEHLNHVATALVDDGTLSDDVGRRLAEGAARCGSPCAPSLESIAGVDSQMRALAFAAVAMMPANERASVLEQLRQAGSPEMTADERRAFERTSALSH